MSNKIQRVVQDSRGRLYAASAGHDQLLVFDRSGRFIRTVGRQGRGPGEYILIYNLMVAPGDTLYLFDLDRRLTVLSPEYSVVRTAPFPVVPERALAASNGSVLVSGPHRTRAAVGQPLHMISSRGEIVRSFGTSEPRVDPDRPSLEMREIAWAGREHFWSAQIARYEIELMDLGGNVLKTLVRQADWFPPRDFDQSQSGVRPVPTVRDIAVDEQGFVWVMLTEPDPNWKASLRAGVKRLTPEIIDTEFDSNIEVLDPVRGRMIAHVRSPHWLTGFAAPGVVYRYDEDEDGDTIAHLLRVQLLGTVAALENR